MRVWHAAAVGLKVVQQERFRPKLTMRHAKAPRRILVEGLVDSVEQATKGRIEGQRCRAASGRADAAQAPMTGVASRPLHRAQHLCEPCA